MLKVDMRTTNSAAKLQLLPTWRKVDAAGVWKQMVMKSAQLKYIILDKLIK